MADVTLEFAGDFRKVDAQLRKVIENAERRLQSSRFANPRINTRGVELPLGRISKSVKEFEGSLDAANARVIAFGASVGVIAAVQRSFASLVRQVTEVEKSLTDINVILGQSQSGLQNFSKGLFNVARETGQSFKSVADAATELARQGLGAEETLIRVRDAMILVRLSGGDAAQAVESLTSIINSFNNTVINSTEVINKLANVDAALATSAQGLAEAIKRTGSTAQDANVSLDETIALVASLQQTTARGETVIGNALKTIFARLQRSTTIEQLQELGVAIDETQGGIDKLKALGDALDGADALTANKIKELAGGVRQINIISAALSDLRKEYSFYNQALEISLSSTDEAIQRNEKLNQTIAALANISLTNITEFFKQIGDAGAAQSIKDLLNAFNSFLDIFKNISGLTESFANLFAPITGPLFNAAIAALGKVVFRVGKDILGYSKTLLGVTTALNKQREIQERIATAVQNTSDKYRQQLAAAKTLAEQETIILKILQQQASIRVSQGAIFAGVAANPSFRRSANNIPNLADSLPSAVKKEIKALKDRGYTMQEAEKLIFVGSDSRTGVAVGNYIDEPSGTIKEGVDNRLKSGKGIHGKYPNFAQEKITGSIHGIGGQYLARQSRAVLDDLVESLNFATLRGKYNEAEQIAGQIDAFINQNVSPKSAEALRRQITRINENVAYTQPSSGLQSRFAYQRKPTGHLNNPQNIQQIRQARISGVAQQLRFSNAQQTLQSGGFVNQQQEQLLIQQQVERSINALEDATGQSFKDLSKTQAGRELKNTLTRQIKDFREGIAKQNQAAFNNALNSAENLPTKIPLFARGSKVTAQIAQTLERSVLDSLPKGTVLSQAQRADIQRKAQNQYTNLNIDRRARGQQAAFLASIGLSLAEPLLSQGASRLGGVAGGATGGAIKGAAGGASIGLLFGPQGAAIGAGIGAIGGGIIGGIEAFGVSVEELAAKLDEVRASFQSNSEAAAQYINTQGQINDLIKAGGSSSDLDKLNEKLTELLFNITDDQLRSNLLDAANNFDALGDALKNFTDKQRLEVAKAEALAGAGQLAESRERFGIIRRDSYSVNDLRSLAQGLANTVDITGKTDGKFNFDIDKFESVSGNLVDAFDELGVKFTEYQEAGQFNPTTLQGIIANTVDILRNRRETFESISTSNIPGTGSGQSLANRLFNFITTVSLQNRNLEQITSSLQQSARFQQRAAQIQLLPQSQRIGATAQLQRERASFDFNQQELSALPAYIKDLTSFIQNNDLDTPELQKRILGAQSLGDLSTIIEELFKRDLTEPLKVNLAEQSNNIRTEAKILALREQNALQEISTLEKIDQVLSYRDKIDASFGGNVLGGLSGISGAATTFNSLARSQVPGNLLRGGQGLSALQDLFPFLNVQETDLFRNLQRRQQSTLVREFQAQSAESLFSNEGTQPISGIGQEIIRGFRQGNVSDAALGQLDGGLRSVVEDIRSFGDQLESTFAARENFEAQTADGIQTLVSLARGPGIAVSTARQNTGALGGLDNALDLAGRVRNILDQQASIEVQIGALRKGKRLQLDQKARLEEAGGIPIEQIIKAGLETGVELRRSARANVREFGSKASELNLDIGSILSGPELAGATNRNAFNTIVDRALGNERLRENVAYFTQSRGNFFGLTDPTQASTPGGMERFLREYLKSPNPDTSIVDADIADLDEKIKGFAQQMTDLNERIKKLNESFLSQDLTADESAKLQEELVGLESEVEAFGAQVEEAVGSLSDFNDSVKELPTQFEAVFGPNGKLYNFVKNADVRGATAQNARNNLDFLLAQYNKRGEGTLVDSTGLGENIEISGGAIRAQFEQLAQSTQGFESFFAGLKSQLYQTQEELVRFGDIGIATAQSIQSNFSQAFGDFVVGAKSGEEAFRSFVGTVLAEVARMLAARAIASVIALVVGSFLPGGATAGPSTGVQAGIIRGGGGFATGYIPNMALGGIASSIAREQVAIANGVGGASPGAEPRVLNIRTPRGNQTIVGNNKEYLVRGYNGSNYDAIFNQNMINGIGGARNLSRYGEPYKIAADGLTPETSNQNSGTINVITEVNVQGDGRADSSSRGGLAPENIQRFSKIIEGVVLKTIQTEKRPGGSLSGY